MVAVFEVRLPEGFKKEALNAVGISILNPRADEFFNEALHRAVMDPEEEVDLSFKILSYLSEVASEVARKWLDWADEIEAERFYPN